MAAMSISAPSRAHLLMPGILLALVFAGTGAAAVPGAPRTAPVGDPAEPFLAGLTDERPEVSDPAIASLIALGPQVVADLEVLSADRRWVVRGRVATVAAGVSSQRAARLLLRMSRDHDHRVREIVALAMGKCPGPGIYEGLRALLLDAHGEVRAAAATGLGTLGDPQAINDLDGASEESDAAVRLAMEHALVALVARPANVGPLAAAIPGATGDRLHTLILAAGTTHDPRLSPALAAVLPGPDVFAAVLAAHSLAASGDSRAVQALCAAAAGADHDLAAAAAETLNTLVGYAAAPGPAWTIWWRDHGADIAGLAPRDIFIASLHDPATHVDRATLSRYSTHDLSSLVEGFLGFGSSWWRVRAWEVLRHDDPARWTPWLFKRIEATSEPNNRLALIVLLDQLGDPGAQADLQHLYEEAEERAAVREAHRKDRRHHNDPELLALEIAISRRQSPAPVAAEPPRRPF